MLRHRVATLEEDYDELHETIHKLKSDNGSLKHQNKELEKKLERLEKRVGQPKKSLKSIFNTSIWFSGLDDTPEPAPLSMHEKLEMVMEHLGLEEKVTYQNRKLVAKTKPVKKPAKKVSKKK